MYTMMVAAMDRKVIAVDILQENIDHIKTSLQMISKTDNVEFLLNAISDEYETLYPKFEGIENGGSSFVESGRENAVGGFVNEVMSSGDLLHCRPLSEECQDVGRPQCHPRTCLCH